LSSFPKLLNDALGTPPAPGGVWLIRPDGYVAATAPANNRHRFRTCWDA
jgi:hypothetical protein